MHRIFIQLDDKSPEMLFLRAHFAFSSHIFIKEMTFGQITRSWALQKWNMPVFSRVHWRQLQRAEYDQRDKCKRLRVYEVHPRSRMPYGQWNNLQYVHELFRCALHEPQTCTCRTEGNRNRKIGCNVPLHVCCKYRHIHDNADLTKKDPQRTCTW